MNRLSVFFLFCLVLALRVDAATLSGIFVPRDPLSNVDLTGAGALDWRHWGLNSTNSNRKGGVTPRINELVLIGGGAPQTITNSVEFSWVDGFPSLAATNVVTTLGTTNLTNGFSIQIPVNTALSKVKIYLGAVAARGQLEMALDDNVLPSTAFLDSTTETNGYYLVDVVANKNNDTLRIRYTLSALYETNGYVSLQAIALTTNANPTISLTSLTNEQNILLGSLTPLQAAAFDSDGTITNVEFFVKGNKVGQAGVPPYEFSWTSTNVGPQTITAVATDHNGAQATSPPVQVYVFSQAGAVVAGISNAPAGVNLTTEGASDWVHWGIYTGDSVDRKTGVVPQIGDATLIGGPAYSFGDNATGFTWTDGSPNVSASDTMTGIYVVGVGNGFQVTFPADANPKTLKLYLGSYAARAKVTAVLSDYSAPVFIDRSINNVGNGPSTVYTLNYAAGSIGQTLTITITCQQMYDGFGNVTLQAATLVNTVDPLRVTLTTPTNNSVFVAPGNIQLQAALAGEDGSERAVAFYNGLTKLGEVASAPYLFNWNSVPPGDYSIVAKATNSLGTVQSSDAVRIFVTGAGGVQFGSFSPGSGSVNLSAEGTADWVHWGLVRKNSLNRKTGVQQQISNFIEIGRGRIDQYADNLVSFNWNDGTPNLFVGGTTTGIFKNEATNGFQITLPADKTLRRLKIYVGLYAACGAFEATLSDFSASPYLHSGLQNVHNNATGVYTVEYAAASSGQTLTVRYTSKTLFDIDFGNVTLQAATLSSIAPRVTSFAVGSSGTGGFNFSTETGWNYTVQATGSLLPSNWQTVAGYTGTGGNISFNDPVAATTNRFYRVTMSR